MKDSEVKAVLQRLTTRVETGLLFIDSDYLPRHKNPDSAWIRNIYILISFYAELLLKTIYIVNGNFKDLEDLDNHLKKLGHNLVKIGNEITKRGKNSFGVNNILVSGYEYLIETDEGNFSIENFNDIRYDFIDGRVRILNGNEHELFRHQVEIMLKINKQLKVIAWES